jgi:hypothetical protein
MVSIFIGFLATARFLRADETRHGTGRTLRDVCELQPAA